MDRGAWRATVHGVAKSCSDVTERLSTQPPQVHEPIPGNSFLSSSLSIAIYKYGYRYEYGYIPYWFCFSEEP